MPTLAQRRVANQNSGCRGWASGGPMVAFYSRWWRAIILGILRHLVKNDYYGMSKNHISVSPQFLTTI